MDEPIPMSAYTLAQAQAQLDALMAASTSQSLSVRYGDRMVTYRSASEIIDLIKWWRSEVARLTRIAAGRGSNSVRLASFR
jgi:hypothetical protein